jgi:serine/threonine protein kinase/WD40 repeat protein
MGMVPGIEAFLAEWPGISPRDLAAVVRVDLRQRWRQGERPTAEDFLRRFPQLQSEVDSVVDLIFAEFLIREELRQDPVLAEFEHRFPEHAAELRNQIELHTALRAAARSLSSIGEINTLATSAEPTIGNDARRNIGLPRLAANYEILTEIGRGGMGVVYRARQVGLNRLVALKMLRAAEYASPELLSRFQAEAEVVARLHHPQIVQVYDYGEHKGLPYLALELVEGGTLAARLDGTPWSPHRAAALIETLARAVQFAHEHGVIHRDLKPANILLVTGTDEHDVKVADFGLAKVFRDNPSIQTQSGALLGTPSYMPPEQAAGKVQQIGPATDVYSLGAILYELLTGRPPFRGETPMETLHQVLTVEPVSVRLIAPRLPRDLATICSKCLRREPERRYPSAVELASDLARFLADQPIRARPSSSWERSWRWCRRNPALSLALGAVAALLFCVATVSTWYSAILSVQLQKTQQAERAEQLSNQTAKLRLLDAYLAEAAARNSSRRVGQRIGALQAIDQATSLLDEIGRSPEKIVQLRNAAMASLALPDLRRVGGWGGWTTDSELPYDFSVAAGRCVFSSVTGEITLCGLSDGREILRLQHSGPLVRLWMSGDGGYIAARGNDGLTVWSIDGVRALTSWKEPRGEYFAFAPGGQCAALGGAREGMWLVDVATGQRLHPLGHGSARSDFAFHAMSNRIAVCGENKIQVISCETGQVLTELTPKTVGNGQLAWHPSGDYLAYWTLGNSAIALWNVQSGQQVMTFDHFGYPHRLDFGGRGSHLLSYSLWDQNLKLWDVATGQKLLEVPTFPFHARDVSANGMLTLLAHAGDRAELWEVVLPTECRSLATALCDSLGVCQSAQVSPESRLLAISRDGGFELWDLYTRQRLAHWPGGGCLVTFDSAGNLLVASVLGLYSWPRYEELSPVGDRASGVQNTTSVRFGPPRKLAGPFNPTSLAFDKAGDLFVFQEQDHWMVMRRSVPDQKLRLKTSSDARKAAVSNDQRFVAITNWNLGGAAIFDAADGRHVADLPVRLNGTALFSPDSRWLATTPDGVCLWQSRDWRLAREMHAQGTTPSGLGIAFSPDSRILAIGQPGGAVRLSDLESGEDYAQFSHPDLNRASVLAFSPDQTQLATLPLEADLPALVWNLAAIRHELARRGLDWPTEILQPQTNGNSASNASPLIVALDAGNSLQQLEAAALLRAARATSREKALGLFQRAATLDPKNAVAHNQLAWLLATGPQELRNAQLSLEHARRAVELEPENSAYINTLGVALYRNALYGEALPALERSLELNREQSGVYDLLFLALCYQAQGDATRARRFFDEARSWADAHRARLPENWQQELARLLNEAHAIVAP